jgi:CheY-like chemotaxis protein
VEQNPQRNAVFRLNGLRVLLVDDNATNRRILSLQCQSWGMVPTITSSAREALEILDKETNFALAILDAAMPEMTGIELMGKIAADPRLQEMAVIMLTSTIDSAAKRQAEAYGVASYLYKPVKQAQLFVAILSTLSGGAHAVRRSGRNVLLDGSFAQRIPLRILLAEDNAINQKVGMLMLSKLGYRADVAANGLEVLEAIADRTYDVILMDLQMPEMDGIEATRRLRLPGTTANRPRIVAVTANVMQSDRDRCVAVGMDEFIGKPIKLEDLAAVLVRAGSAIGISAQRPVEEPTTRAQTHPPLSGIPLESARINREALDKLRILFEDEGELLRLVIEHIHNAGALLATIHASITTKNVEELRRAAHTLKSSAAMFGATRVSRCAAELEAEAKRGDWIRIQELASELVDECKQDHIALVNLR